MMSKDGELPPLSAYSFDGILGSIREVIEEDLNGIAEILGHSRLVLADQHESHLPPTGEIRAGQLPALPEASSSNERLAGDDVLILNENASLVDGSHAGSAAYGLLERLQAVPRTRRMHSEVTTSAIRPNMPVTESSPAILTEASRPLSATQAGDPTSQPRPSPQLLRLTSTGAPTSGARTTAVVSEVWLSAGADGQVVSDPPIVSEAGRNYPLYSYDESQLFETPESARSPGLSFAARMQRLLLLRDLQGALTWAASGPSRETGRRHGGSSSSSNGGGGRVSQAESQLRDILGKHPAPAAGGPAERTGGAEEAEMYQ